MSEASTLRKRAQGSDASPEAKESPDQVPSEELDNYSYEITAQQRNEVTKRIETEILDILQWKRPLRSAAILISSVGFLFLTRTFSVLRMLTAALTVITAVNLVYVTCFMETQKVFSDKETVSHPYGGLLGQRLLSGFDRKNIVHVSTIAVELAETIVRGITRIVLVEDTMSTVKWLVIFYWTWCLAVNVSSRIIAIIFIVSAFIFPRLYITNKDLVEARIQQGETLIRESVHRTQAAATETMNEAYAKAKAYVGKGDQKEHATAAR
ncbi:uncharacterized protein BYT42DRAFT_553139 [Radiomyces spectabilis]|uniref:uncharacterized protein n=1 Tax=Radiomyces spectabilis TaxID=64574 RepID=UPI00221F47D1|nr:uncharacterized protein BYT42DRAFT_553139 [Radiomyces spectabilis]KAI8394048.1 hypothetical protein BYT42DRAFT_553139 [Radiomyces spectabilis]